MIEHFPQFVPQKVCLSCDGCCRFKEETSVWRPKITKDEIAQVRAKKSSLIDKIFSKEHVGSKGYLKTIKQKSICKCTFFNLEQNTCTIYSDRPFECQIYPFLLNKKGKELAVSVHLWCPYIQKKRYTAEFEGYVVSLKNFFHKESTRVFLRNNPSLFNDYSEFADEIEAIFSVNL